MTKKSIDSRLKGIAVFCLITLLGFAVPSAVKAGATFDVDGNGILDGGTDALSDQPILLWLQGR